MSDNFSNLLDKYFTSRGTIDIKKYRSELADDLNASSNIKTRIRQILEIVNDSPFSENMDNGVDVLLLAGERKKDLLKIMCSLIDEIILEDSINDDDGLYVLVTAVNSLDIEKHKKLLKSPNETVREASLDSISNVLDSKEIKQFLLEFIKNETSEYLKHYAKELLQNVLEEYIQERP